jgi:hypothetical protein
MYMTQMQPSRHEPIKPTEPATGLLFEQILPGLREGKKYRADGWQEHDYLALTKPQYGESELIISGLPGWTTQTFNATESYISKPVWHEYHD